MDQLNLAEEEAWVILMNASPVLALIDVERFCYELDDANPDVTALVSSILPQPDARIGQICIEISMFFCQLKFSGLRKRPVRNRKRQPGSLNSRAFSGET
ncbi:MAG: hypothetical protein ACOYL3_01290 [Desulfuromonadaceae bacterium]